MLNDKFFLIDIDGCMTDGKNKNIDIGALKYFIEYVHSINFNYSICTGRSATYVEAFSQMLSYNGWCICENGAYIYHTKTDSVIVNPVINNEVEEDLFLAIQTIKNKSDEWFFKFEMGKEYCISLNPIEGSVKDLYLKVNDLLSEGFESLNLDYSTTAVDVTPSGVHKGSGMDLLISKLDVGSVDFIGIGDSSGDMPFLKKCNLTGCPSNASSEIKNMVSYVSNYNSLRGVIDIIEFFEKKPA